MGCGAHIRVDPLPRQARDICVTQAAGDDAAESRGRINVDIEGNAVQCRSARDFQTDRADFAVCPPLFGEPHSGAPLDSVDGKFPFFADRCDHSGFDCPDPRVQVDGFFEFHDRVAHELTGTMPGC